MDEIIKSSVNDYVCIKCKLKRMVDNKDEYFIVPCEVSIGKIKDDGNFVIENTLEELESIDKKILGSKNTYFYFEPICIENLTSLYPDCKNDMSRVCKYYMDITNKVNVLYRNPDTLEIKCYSFPLSDELLAKNLNDVEDNSENEDSKEENKDVYINNSDNDTRIARLQSIKRKELAKYLKDRIIGNDSTIDDISTAVVSNFRAKNPKLIKNFLCVGPTGSGKTETFKLIANYAGIPLSIIDCNQLTAEGYVGKGVDDIFRTVIATCDFDLDLANRSILVFDEVDKIASRGDSVTDIKVQEELLKILEGFKFQVNLDSHGKQAEIDTSFMMKVASGAFNELFEKSKSNKIGFGSTTDKDEKVIKELTDEDIIKYGFLPEFVGRFPLIYTYKNPDMDTLKQILRGSKNSPLKLEQERLKEEFSIDVVWSDDLIKKIAEKASTFNSGARSLDRVVKSLLIKLERALFDAKDDGKTIPSKIEISSNILDEKNDFEINDVARRVRK